VAGGRHRRSVSPGVVVGHASFYRRCRWNLATGA
jgi:hypothetical protein